MGSIDSIDRTLLASASSQRWLRVTVITADGRDLKLGSAEHQWMAEEVLHSTIRIRTYINI